ncbi:3-methyl-2-oxobutanoate hydroxymethyltransferase [Christiangramia fulva]|uniref:3-methyl-2-oxobutanoate hydroxymethyltransferase n=1 Tax=Christiangramia fulva TaxID=2126553 RepID=A0A2R3ZB72_9FLAO|nr:nuclear transport factor 2 family protein [Christiangramia fulva]AVR47538.1 3-methyl-2-oxobutanoate hydroxymethyltransferase [Christiangramia fulva]
MKRLFFLSLILIGMAAFSQSKDSENTPKKMVEDFFEAFHQQDTVKLKEFALESTILQSISIDAEGNTALHTDSYEKFLKGIASIPKDASFQEKLHEFRIEENNNALATVTTPYTFYFNGSRTHCGVNSFTLVKLDGEWKIAYLIDTRTKDCD